MNKPVVSNAEIHGYIDDINRPQQALKSLADLVCTADFDGWNGDSDSAAWRRYGLCELINYCNEDISRITDAMGETADARDRMGRQA